MKGNKTHAKDAIGLGDKLNEGWDLSFEGWDD